MKKILLYAILSVVGSGSLRAESAAVLSGAWRGDLKMGNVALPLVFNFNMAPDGSPAFTLDSPQQNVKGLPLTVNYISCDSISVAASNIGAAYNGRVADGAIEGIFSQRGFTFPLTLTPEQPIELRRPQTPKAPYPYQTSDTTFTSSDGVRLSGTMTIPRNATEKTPVVVMVTGSGPQNRDEEIFEHQPFAVIADYLARNGIASFRYDDRGVGSSEGNFATSTIKTFEADCESAVNFVRGLKRFGDVGILGHSEGGTIAMLLAGREVPDFIVSLAGMAIKGKETILDQNRHTMTAMGLSESDIEGSMAVIEALFDEIISKGGDEGSSIDVDKIAQSRNVTLPPVVMQSVKRNVAAATPYFAELLTVDAAAGLENIRCPFLAINGTLDTQVDSGKNLGVIRATTKKAEVKELPGLNHLLQHATTGEVAEYSEIRETIAPEVLEIIKEFILRNSQ
jgi:alpha-beta hydrolase superfamily lysophospholipase